MDLFRKKGELPLIKSYLVSVQTSNLSAVNEALNAILIEEADFEGLRESIETYDAYDAIGLAKQLEGHELLEFRRISCLVYKKLKKYSASIKLSLEMGQTKDAMATVAVSGQPELAEELLQKFVDTEAKEAFAALLFTCFDLLKPDLVMEKAWRAGWSDASMPYMIATVRDLTSKVDMLCQERKERQAKEAKEGEDSQNANQGLVYAQQMLPPATGYGQAQGGYAQGNGMGYQG